MKKDTVVRQRRRSNSVTHHKRGNVFVNAALIVAAVSTGIFLLYPDSVIVGKKTLSTALASEKKNADDSYVGSSVGGVDWKNPALLQKSLETRLFGSLKSVSAEGVQAFASDARRQLELAQWMLADAELKSALAVQHRLDFIQLRISELEKQKAAIDEERKNSDGVLSVQQNAQLERLQGQLEQLRKEWAYPHTVQDALKQPGAMELMEKLGNNLDWLQQLLYSGELERPGEVISILNHLRRLRPEILTGSVERNIATATALEFARHGWSHDAAIARADFYLRNWKKGVLNTVFEQLPFWELRMVCGGKGDNDFGSVESLQWSLDNVHLPADQYPDCCWRCGYKTYNPYGESIHGPGYKEPFAPMYGRNAARFTYEVGGVCGSLSHFGAFAAMANGIPAMTVGEPEHCAFIVKVGDKWVPSYSLSWERDLHWNYWKNVRVFSSLHAASEMSSAAQKQRSKHAEIARSLAAALSTQDISGAASMYEVAIGFQPLNFKVWRDYVHFLQNKNPLDKQAWEKLHTLMCKHLVPAYPELAAALCNLHLYGALKVAYQDEPETLQRFAVDFWKAVDKMGPDRWHIESLIDAQMSLLDEKETSGCHTAIYANILNVTAGNAVYAPIILAKGAEMMQQMPDDKRKDFMASMVRTMEASLATGGADRNEILAPVILAAERQEDSESFHALNKMVEKNDSLKPRKPLPAMEPMPGRLVSEDGVVRASSTCRWDEPCAHQGIMLPQGGFIHTASEENPWVAVRLSKLVEVTGVVIALTDDNMNRLSPIKVQISESGKDDDWHDVAQLEKVEARIIRLDLAKEKRRANYVRVQRIGGPEFFHLNGIYVYGNPAS